MLSSHCSEIMPIFGLKGDLVIFLELSQEAQASSRVVTGVRRNFSSSQNGVQPPFQLPGGTWDCSRVATGESGLISGSGWGGILWCFFVLQLEALGSSLVAKGIWGNFVLPKVSQVSFRVVKGNSGLLSCHCSEIPPHFWLRVDLLVFLKLW